eukprot:5400545-Pyramimonas_sp.AAC.1
MSAYWQQAELHFDGEGLRDGTDSYSYRRLLAQLSQVQPAGKRLAAVLLSVAIGGSWTKARKADQYASSGVSRTASRADICDRCGEERETSHHRAWLCRCNTGSAAYKQSDCLVAKAGAQHEQTPCFWLRGLIPRPWTTMPAPIYADDWEYDGINAFGPRCLPEGSALQP